VLFKRNYLMDFPAPATVLSALSFIIFGCLYLPSPAHADLALFSKHIVEYNLKKHELSLSDRTYRGEEGVLRINPEAGRSLGLKVLINQDYLKATALYSEAEDLYEKAIEAMDSQEKEAYSGEHVKTIEQLGIRHNNAIALGWEHMLAYRSKLTTEVDDRLNTDCSSRLLEKLLTEELEKASHNLRNALGRFYNRCQDLHEDPPLNLENIKFVNHVFYEFTEQATTEAQNRFDLDRCDTTDIETSWSMWKYALGRSSSRFAAVVEDAFEKNPSARKNVDVLLFLALMRQESNFKPRNVSYVGAAGLTQIMPSTAKGLGMKDIFSPSYLKEAGSLLGQERKLKKKAKDQFLEITESNSAEPAEQARRLRQKSLTCGTKRKDLYVRYKKELLKSGTDDRLDPHKAAQYGLKYFSHMMKIQKGDASLALASYNAGPHRVKQYKGIPPYDETIGFRNKILKYYQIYLARAKKNSLKQAKIQEEPS
jgi:soluble lytic murein transglycosylase-like protein